MSEETKSSKASLWPYMIIGWFVIFITAITIWVSYAMRNSQELVKDNYYEEEIRFQQQMDRVNRTKPLKAETKLSYDPQAGSIFLQLPPEHATENPTGTIRLYRPSNAALDQDLPLQVNHSGAQTINAAALQGGLWKVRVQWKVKGLEYYLDQSVVVVGKS